MLYAVAWRLLPALSLLLGVWFAYPLHAQVAVPPLKARVTDLTGTLQPAQRDALEQRLAAFEAKKGSQIAVLLVPTTQPESVEQYAIRVAEQWKLGRKGVDDGVLLVVAMKDRTVRIEVGYGLEGVLPDATTRRIIEQYIVPRFKQGDFSGGIKSAVDRVIGVIEGEALPAPKPRPTGGVSGWENFIVIGFFLVFVLGGILRAMLGRVGGSGVLGAVAGFLAWTVIGSLAAAAIIGVLLFIFSLFGGIASPGYRGRHGGWYPGGGGWSSGGGGFGGGGFGGGGGGFGGGGASGRW